MSVTAPPRPPRPGDPVDRDELEALVNALIEEARRRARRRRLLYAAAAASIALAGIVAFTVFDHAAQSRSASPTTGARTGLAAAAQSKIAFITAVPRAKLPKGYGWLAEVNVMNADGSGKRTLTRNPGLDAYPTWSPDGRKIAFAHGQALGNQEVYVMNADGTGQRNLTRNPAYDFTSGFPWSPDGRKIVFASDRDGNAEVYVMNADGTGQRRLTRNAASDAGPSWSPDGRKIAFVRQDGPLGSPAFPSSEVYVMNADGSGQRRLRGLVP